MAGDTATVESLLEQLWERGLCWRSPEGLRPVRTVTEIMGDPAGLGPSVGSLVTPVPAVYTSTAALQQALASLSGRARAILAALTWGPATGLLPSRENADPALAAAGQELIVAGVLVLTSDTQVVLPREAALVLRGGRLHRSTSLHPPEPAGPVLDQAVVDSAAGGQAGDVLVLIDELAAEWGARPPRVLRAGGLAVRDLKRITTVLDVQPGQAAFIVELAAAADLVAGDGSAEPSWAPTPGCDTWREQPSQQRWATLALAWLTTPRAASLVGAPVGSGTANALGPDTVWPAGRQRRVDVLAELAGLPEGSAPEADSLEERLRWRYPLRLTQRTDAGVDVVLAEAEWVGVTGRGALTTAGRALPTTGDPDAAAGQMAGHIPAPVDHVLLQADLTAIALGRLDGPLHHLLRLTADVESRGGATVFRFSPGSVRRALDAGWSASTLLESLTRASRTGVPQPLEYLVNDVARRHGVTRVGSVGSYVRSDDAAALDTMVADRGLGLLQLRRIAPTVLVSPVPATTALDLLREQGYSPVAESTDGGVVVPAAPAHRAPTQRRTASVQVSRVDAEAARALVTNLREGESASRRERERRGGQDGPRLESTDPTVTLALLREAVSEGFAVWIGHVDSVGGMQRVLLRPQRIEGGRVLGTTGDLDVPRSFSIHRISGVAPAT